MEMLSPALQRQLSFYEIDCHANEVIGLILLNIV